ncbi:hypothetical protein [Zobellella sp. DQSA1]|uniref:hypothetical protein n=1 Tax=Zobellella sp. DQSA1 TaxID=3342386 RepID=UPI0035BF523D
MDMLKAKEWQSGGDSCESTSGAGLTPYVVLFDECESFIPRVYRKAREQIVVLMQPDDGSE